MAGFAASFHLGMDRVLKSKRVTLTDVARLAGLSVTTASMILTGRPDTRLSDEARAKVHAAAASLGYRPNIAARVLRTDESRSIAFISDYVATTRYANGLIRGALAAAQDAGQVLLVLETEGDAKREIRAVQAALDRQVDGIIFASMRARTVVVPDLEIPTPVVVLNGTSSRFPLSVLPNEFDGGRAAVRLLVESGIRDGIVLLGHSGDDEHGPFRTESIIQRFHGIRHEMRAQGVQFHCELGCWKWEAPFGFDLVSDLLRRYRPRALLCLNDPLAFGAYQAIHEAGARIPEDIALVSFDNDELAAILRPGLTTIGLPHEDMGREAVRLLLDPDAQPGTTLVSMPAILRGSLPTR